jgi:hypothetical protein
MAAPYRFPARMMRAALGAFVALLLVPAVAMADTVFAPADGPGGDSITDAPL